MPAMSFMHSFGGLELKGPEIEENVLHEARRIADSGDSVQSLRSSNGSPSPSGQGKSGLSRPPGLGGMGVSSPLGKPGHSYTSSASTVQNLTLTPTSSLDGGDLYRQSSPFHGDGPSMTSEYSRRGGEEGELPPGIFDAEDNENDGLLGLQALRDRAHSSPGPMGPYSSSPPIRGQIGSLEDGRGVSRPRTVSRDNGRSQPAASRPPRSGGSALSPHTTDNKSYSGYSSSGSRSRDPSPTPPGIISRPGNQYEVSADRPYDPSRRRSTSTDTTGREFPQVPYGDRNQPTVDQLAHKFGQMGNQSQGLHPQNVRPGQHGYQGHSRSSSLPGPMIGAGTNPDYYPEDPHHNSIRRGSDFGAGITSRHPAQNEYRDVRYNNYQSQYDQNGAPPAINQRRSSLQAVPGGAGFYGQTHTIHRHQSLDFVPGQNRYLDGVPVVAANEEMRMCTNPDDHSGSYRQDRMVSPAHSPMHVQYGSHHNRHPSDMGNSALSSSPMSHGSGGMGGAHGHGMYQGNPRGGRHRVTNSDDDLSHPLIGEHIDVHGDDRGYHMNGILDHPHARGRHGLTDPPLPHYGGAAAAHVMPATGAVPAPKIVHNVKFKRTKRYFALGPRLNRDLKVGTYVKVEADRGEDLGIIVGKVPPEKYIPSHPGFRGGGVGEMGVIPPPSGMGPRPSSADMKCVIRLATHEEVALLMMKREEEEELLRICRTKVQQRGLQMNVVDAEYQFDRHKLTFFFEAEGRVDFRELVRDLFSMYKTRIWMQQLDKSTSASCPTAPEESQQVAIDYGTPIMAPESEYTIFANGVPGENAD